MRSVLVYILLFAIMLPTVSPWGTIACFQLNRDYIARVLCENRDRPQMNCNGQCYLAKRLKAQQDKQDKETTERVQNLPGLQLFWQAPAVLSVSTDVIDLTGHSTHFIYLLKHYSAPLTGLLQPPRR
ncbi:hypothetical protein [Arsenicibacter rosenii]|uniref:Uncharacterized protein n=1 Tax=Arsenicibacter rosenii TaxID=1750698 RepID=A0A1S2VJW6_9BACT|nr:hypothetical protein [Arsenicibacter rosenii]OIN59077.1 hypothetical protein BLX24_12785 [Arsenicibacter rosenii]